MKYLCLNFTITILIIISAFGAFSQKAYYGEPDVAVNLNDSVVIRLNDYEGSIQWQKSIVLNVWENIPGATLDTLLFVANITTYFRAEVIAGECEPFYSDITGIGVFRVITLPVTDVTNSSALSGGNVLVYGGTPVTARGVVWSTTLNPTIGSNDGITSDGSGLGEFSSNLTGLIPETTYYVRAYALNSAGITYGQPESFSTLPAVEEPFEYLLTGEVSKTWKLYRVGSSMGVGPILELPTEWWSLENDGTRPCAYYHEFTFYNDGDYGFDDKGFMWAEGGVFHEDLVGECIEAIPSNMIGPNGEDLSAWLSGMHTFEYNSNTNMVTLNGLGAWIGLVIIGTVGDVAVPQNSVSFNADIEEREGYDYMHVWFEYDAGYVWSFYYAHYHDPSLEPEVVEEQD